MRGRKSKIERERIAAAYVRVSTREQSTEGHSLAAQETRLRSLAESQGVALGRVFIDAGQSAGTLERPAIRELLAAIERGEISALYICKLDRLSRNLEDLLGIVRLCKNHNVALVSASEAIDTGSPAGRMMISMLGGFAEFERARISERIADVAFDLRRQGKVYCRHAPFGYRRDGKTLLAHPMEQAALATMRQMHANGASYRQIATMLTERGVQPKGRAWYAASVRDVLRSRMNATSAA
jgi:site-specific DNA recombinase